MHIIQLESQNVKKIKAICIRPDGNTIVLGGKNGAGKSSVLDSIMYALAGKSAVCEEPVRRGEDSATIKVNTGQYIITRTFGAAGSSTITVQDASTGAKFPSPQALLDRLTGDLAFDPLAFCSMKPDAQLLHIQKVAGIDIAPFVGRRRSLYEERTMVGREVKNQEGFLSQLGQADFSVPEQEVSPAEVLAKLKAAREQNAMINDTRRAISDEESESAKSSKLLAELRAKIKEIENQEIKRLAHIRSLVASLDGIDPCDESQLESQLVELEKSNQKVRKNLQIAAARRELQKKKVAYDTLSAKIGDVDADQSAAVASANMPVPGLSISESGITYNGIPFQQISSAEQLRVSVAMGMALNPTLRVIFVRNGSLLDEDGMKLIHDMAAQNNYQVWIETVGNNKDVSVMIVDGLIETGE